MAKQTVNLGTAANDGTGDPLRTAFDKVNDNFDEVYGNNFVTTAMLGADVVTGAKIADDAVDSEHINNGSIDLAHLAANCVNGAKIVDDAIDSEHYVDGSIDTAHIADDQIHTQS